MDNRTDRLRIWRLWLSVLAWVFVLTAWSSLEGTFAAETVFLQDGRTIQADKVEIIGDRVRIEKPAQTIEIPRSDVLSIHPRVSPKVSPGPADVYRDSTQQMNERVRREIESRPGVK
jgi:hypothetical protein